MITRILFVVSLFGVLSARAQGKEVRFKHLTTSNGLSNNKVLAIFKDHLGFMWFGTEVGLNKYDGAHFVVYRNESDEAGSLSGNTVRHIVEDSDHNLWLATYGGGLCRYNRHQDNFTAFRSREEDANSLSNDFLNVILEDSQQNLWIGTLNGLNKFDRKTGRFTRYTHRPGDPGSLANNTVEALYEDNRGNLWVGTWGGGLNLLDRKTGRFRQYIHAPDQPLSISQNHITSIVQDSAGHLWVGNRWDGLNRFDYQTQTFTRFRNNGADPGSLGSDEVLELASDGKGHLWIGTLNRGLDRYDASSGRFTHYGSDPLDENSLSNGAVNAIYSDESGTLWIATAEGIDYYNPAQQKFKLYRNHYRKHSLSGNDIKGLSEDPDGYIWMAVDGGGLNRFDPLRETFVTYPVGEGNRLNSLSVLSVAVDRDAELWIGTYDKGLNRFNPKTNTFTHYQHDPSDTNSPSGNSIRTLLQDRRGNLWLGTIGNGLNRYDKRSQTFTRIPCGKEAPDHVVSCWINHLYEDRQGRIWVSTFWGVEVFDYATNAFTHFQADTTRVGSLSSNDVYTTYQDRKGRIWVGTRNGLNLFIPDSRRFKAYTKADGLPSNTIFSINEDARGSLWLGTMLGLSNFNPDTGEVRNFGPAEDIQGDVFSVGASLRTRDGSLYIGGSTGLNRFHPDSLVYNRFVPPVYLTSFSIFNKPIPIDRQSFLKSHINEVPEIGLSYRESVFSVEFAALNFIESYRNAYAYKLEGFDADWNYIGTERKATFTNLDPGEYVLRVKAANNDGVWNEKGTALRIHIAPPFWKTRAAWAFYLLLLIGALLLARHLVLERARMNFQLEQEHEEARRLLELDALKTKFFTNVSHEFRTPLSLILAPLDALVKKAGDPHQQQQLQLVQRNAKRLLHLVNQLLDFRRLEVQEIRLAASEGDVVQLLREVTASFADLSEKKHIRLSFHSAVPALRMSFDPDKLERILFNLLSNAFKFTPEHGVVSVELLPVPTEKKGAEEWLDICVRDTGIGIPKEQQDSIFERFFQHELPSHLMNQGSGIGLSITREFVRLHGGRIWVESEPDHGSTFTVRLPLRFGLRPALPPDQLPEAELLAPASQETGAVPKEKPKKALPTLLLVEDNEDFRFYLQDNLRRHYTILEAANGKEGWKRALTALPDLIVSDVAMPEMDGVELCRKVKADPRTTHIPVILLTARTQEEQQLEGIRTGASDYITKPFAFELLQARLKNLLLQRDTLNRSFQARPAITASPIVVPSLDDKLLKKALSITEANIANPDFSVEELSREIGMSRVYLYKKLVAITGKTPIEFIRIVRLRRAAQLLEQSQLNVSEIAYEVGFNSPRTFTKYFKQEYHVLPSDYQAQHGVGRSA